MKKPTFFLLIVIFNFFMFQSISARDFIIVGIPEEPNRWIDTKGNPVGIDVDIIEYIMKKMNIPYQIRLEATSARMEFGWKSDPTPYDMVFTYSKNAERAVFLTYANESHIDFSWNFFIRKEDEGKYKYDTFNDLKGVRIGATKEFSYTADFWKAGTDGLLSLDIIVKNDLQLDKLLAGRIEMVPLNTKATLYELRKSGLSSKVAFLPKPLKSSAYYNTFVKKSDYPNMPEIIKKYDEILKEMKKDGTLKTIFAKYGL